MRRPVKSNSRRLPQNRAGAKPERARAALYTDGDRARIVPEDALPQHGSPYRSDFRRDYARLVHSPALRRLQGKTQLFPGLESDFFRNRLTHCLEVAQVAKSIALRLNTTVPELADHPIDVDIVEFAGLAHDLGHPPFGHNGEKALDRLMSGFGGFEGNAQTLRILTRLEKKRLRKDAPLDASSSFGIDASGKDYRVGLNLTARSIAAVLKYDNPIAVVRDKDSGIAKGFYRSDEEVVSFAKKHVLVDCSSATLKTIECQIMDLADDIAYSTYDLEDTFKAGFLNPLDLLSLPPEVLDKVAESVSKQVKGFTANNVLEELVGIFGSLQSEAQTGLASAVEFYQSARETATSGYLRTELTAELVGEFVEGVEFEYNSKCPPLSRAWLRQPTLRRVETLKHLTYEATILSSRLKVAEYRGSEIVETIFDALSSKGGDALLPDDFRTCFRRSSGAEARTRVVCDFIAGMTDAYAIEFYARLRSENARTIFKPL